MGIKDDHIIAFFLSFLFLLLVLVPSNGDDWFNQIKRSDFPEGFTFGSASSAYQYEGGVSSKGKSIWDTFTHLAPARIAGGENGDIALDTYHRYKEDLSIMEETGFKAYRFSIAWSRVLPKGTLKGGINQEGIDYYNSLINATIEKGLEPYVTLFHWDVPQALEDEYNGFLDRRILNDFKDYVDLCFRHFGDRVKHWITVNEPNLFAINSYGTGTFAPGRCSKWVSNLCDNGHSSIEPYIVLHHQILAHAITVKHFRTNYQEQKGMIGPTVIVNWYEPYTNSHKDVEAAKRATEFFSGWFFDPIIRGDYPESMKIRVKDRLPKFTEEEKEMIRGSFDFLGLNYYTAAYAIDDDSSIPVQRPTWFTDSGVNSSIALGQKVNASSWLASYPPGLNKILVDMKHNYNDPTMMITENGWLDFNDPDPRKLICDKKRILYHIEHLYYLLRAILMNGVKVKGYFAWSLLDTFEWQDGYTKCFGLVYIDRSNNLERIGKKSLEWFNYFLRT